MIFAGHIARPTLEAVAFIEDAAGPICDVARRLVVSPMFGDAVAVLGACIASGGKDEVDADALSLTVLDVGLELAFAASHSLVSSYFVRGEQATEPKSASGDSPWFPAAVFVGQAVAVWGQSPLDVWRWTVPEWWSAYDAFVIANGGGKAGEEIPSELARQLAADIRAAKRAEREKNAEILRERARLEQEGAVAE